jgi:hypothetical protein
MKTATTWKELVANYEVFVNTDAVPVEAMHDDIKAYAAANKLLFTDTLEALYKAIFGPEPF